MKALTKPDAELLHRDPPLALRMIGEAVERGVPLFAWARDAIGRMTSDPAWCASWRTSRDLLEVGRGIFRVLSRHLLAIA